MKKFAGLFLTGVLSISFLQAEEAVLKAVKGTVMVKPAAAKDWRKAKTGTLLQRNDRVKLGAGALAQVVFKAGDAVLVKENSRFSIKRDKRGTLISFDVGEFLIGIKRKLKPNQAFRVRTPAAVAAVRGTSFWGITDEQKSTTYACFTGSIEIWAKGESVKLQPGEVVEIPMGQTAGAATASNIAPDFINTFAISGSLQGVDQIIKTEGQ